MMLMLRFGPRGSDDDDDDYDDGNEDEGDEEEHIGIPAIGSRIDIASGGETPSMANSGKGTSIGATTANSNSNNNNNNGAPIFRNNDDHNQMSIPGLQNTQRSNGEGSFTVTGESIENNSLTTMTEFTPMLQQIQQLQRPTFPMQHSQSSKSMRSRKNKAKSRSNLGSIV